MPRTQAALQSPDKYKSTFLNDIGVEIIKYYATARTYTGFGRFASYKDEHGEWLIGYGSKIGRAHV